MAAVCQNFFFFLQMLCFFLGTSVYTFMKTGWDILQRKVSLVCAIDKTYSTGLNAKVTRHLQQHGNCPLFMLLLSFCIAI